MLFRESASIFLLIQYPAPLGVGQVRDSSRRVYQMACLAARFIEVVAGAGELGQVRSTLPWNVDTYFAKRPRSHSRFMNTTSFKIPVLVVHLDANVKASVK
jgi:hypothetical protein